MFYLATTADNYGKGFGGGHDKKPFGKHGLGRFLLKVAQLICSNLPEVKNSTVFLTVPYAEHDFLKMFYSDEGFQKGWGKAQESIDTQVQFRGYGAVQHLSCTQLICQLPLAALDMDFGCGLSMEWRNKQCISSVSALPDVMKRDVFGGVVAS